MITKLKNTTVNPLDLDDIGTTISVGGEILVIDIPFEDYRTSLDIKNNIASGSLVFVDDLDIELSTQQSTEELNITANLDLSDYIKTSDMEAYVTQRISEIAGTNPMNILTDIVELPIYSLPSSKVYFAKQNSNNSKFYKSSTSTYHIDDGTTNLQTLADITGSGILGGILLPELETHNGAGRAVTVSITLDGQTTTEVFNYDDSHNDSYRLYLGSLTTRKNELYIFEDTPNRRCMTTNRRPQHSGYFNNVQCYIPHLSTLQTLLYLPRMKFNSDLKVTYQCSESLMYENSSYQNRATAFYYLLG